LICAKTVIEQLKEHGEVIRGWLGIGIQDITEEISDYYGIKGVKGVLVTEVFTGDPADKAGIRPKDTCTEMNSPDQTLDLAAKGHF
jgi:serine protease Do